MDVAEPALRLRTYRPEVSNLWLRHSVAGPSLRGPAWFDLGERRLGGYGVARRGSRTEPRDLVYFPPASPERRVAVEEAGRLCDESGIPYLLHHVVGFEESTSFDLNGNVVHDPLHAVFSGRTEWLELVPPGSTVLWPVIAGLTDRLELVDEALDRLSGVDSVVPVLMSVEPAESRVLIERYGEHYFAALFHGGESDVAGVVKRIKTAGIDVLPPRPPSGSERLLERRVTTELRSIAEVLLWLGESEAFAQDFFRAAAWVEESPHDLEAMVREGNLSLVPALGAEILPVVEELAAGAPRSGKLAGLCARLGG